MYLLSDCGATKSDWILFDQSGIHDQFQTSGINPMVQTPSYIAEVPLAELRNHPIIDKVKGVFFYGAGLRTEDKVEVVRVLLSDVFPGTPIEIEHDLLGSARATCQKEVGITCILGTGSNSCWFDGEKIISELGGNGHLLGDEGSGADLGRHLLKAALDQELTIDLQAELEKWSGKKILELRNEAYFHPHPNNYFANFSKFIAEHLHNPAIQGMVLARLLNFFGKTVLKYSQYTTVKVHFVGSIPLVYQVQLARACELLKIQAGRMIKQPAQDLVKYHLAKLNK